MEFELLASGISLESSSSYSGGLGSASSDKGTRDYTKQILAYMTAEQRDHTFSTFSVTYEKYRKPVAEWMFDVCDYFQLHPTTTHAAIYYLDRLHPNEKYTRQQWQMLAISCILLSSKYNECEEHVPDKRTLEGITQQKIQNDMILSYELFALKQMGWKLNVRTPMAFLHSYLELGILNDCEKENHANKVNLAAAVTIGTDSKLEIEAKVIDENMPPKRQFFEEEMKKLTIIAILNVQFKPFKSSDIACAIVYICRLKLGLTSWSTDLTRITLNQPERPDVVSIIQLYYSLDSASSLPLAPILVNRTNYQALSVSTSSVNSSQQTTAELTPTKSATRPAAAEERTPDIIKDKRSTIDFLSPTSVSASAEQRHQTV